MTDWNLIESKWQQMRGKIREKWGKLTDNDLNVIKGKREQLEGRLRELYGKTENEIRREVDEFLRTCVV